jgi:hypothetical protein
MDVTGRVEYAGMKVALICCCPCQHHTFVIHKFWVSNVLISINFFVDSCRYTSILFNSSVYF